MCKKKLAIIPVMLGILLFAQLAFADWNYIPQVAYASMERDGDGPVDYYYLIVAASTHWNDQFYKDTAYLTLVLLNDYWASGDRIMYLHPDPSINEELINGTATKQNVKTNITDWLGDVADGNDVVFIYIDSHGGGFDGKSFNDTEPHNPILDGGRISEDDEQHEHRNPHTGSWFGVDECIDFSIDNETYWDDEFRDDLDKVNCGAMIVLLDMCYSGGFIDDLSADNRIIMTAANETYLSWMDLDGDGFSEFLEVFVDALHGYGTYWNGSSYQDDSELEEWPPCYDGDLDNLFYVSLWETFQYAWKYDDYRILGDESPWYDDDGDKLPTYKDDQDHYDESQGGLANQTDIFRPPGDLIGGWLSEAPDGDVDIFDLVVVTGAYGSSPGEPNWNPKADVNNDSIVDIFDLVLTALYYEFRTPINKRIGSSSREQSRAGETVVSVYPDEITVYRHESFRVNVTITNATDLYGWEFMLYWNNTLLNCTSAQTHSPDIWGNNTFQAGTSIENAFNATHGRYFKAMAALHPASSFNGTMTAVTLTFEAKAAGISTLNLEGTKLANSTARPISHTTVDGSVTVLPQTRYMRGDKHTVNNLEAYKLTTSQSATQKTATKEASGIKTVYWGIRVWKRNSAGTETEITGGTPVAQVSRSSNGQGIQSNSWNCPQTSLQETDAIVVRVYMKFGSGSWKLCCTFITEQLESEQLDSSQWTVYYYTWRYYAIWERKTYGFFRWGTSTYNSRIANFEYT